MQTTDHSTSEHMNRREFLKRAGAAMTWLALPYIPEPDHCKDPMQQLVSRPLPASLGRITTWWRQAVHTEPSLEAEWVAWKTRDEIIPLYAAVVGQAPWQGNPTWYQTEGGFIHSGYVQPVEDEPSLEVLTEIPESGFWAQVCVPMTEARWSLGSQHATKLYYGTVYRVAGAVEDGEHKWWYQLENGVAFASGPYVPSWAVRRIPPEEMTPISPGSSGKWIEISIQHQRLTCFEGDKVVFHTHISSGVRGTATPTRRASCAVQAAHQTHGGRRG